MFRALFFKEWKEKFIIISFGAIVLLLALAVYLGFPKDQTRGEFFTGALLVFFFPFMALLIGAGGFEPEFRNDSWAYLFSRPVGKGTIWAVKYISLLSQLACLWLAFLGMMATFPGLRALVVGLRLPVAFGTEINFLPWSLLFSFFLFTLAFSLSPLSDKWLNLLFGALFIGLGLAFAAYWASTLVTALLLGQSFDETRWLHAFRWGIIFMGGGFAAASLLTFTHTDFSQPRKKTARFVRLAGPAILAAIILSSGWTALLPHSGEHYISLAGDVAGRAYINTTAGIFEYDSTKDELDRIAGSGFFLGSLFGSSYAPVRNGDMLVLKLGRRNSLLTLWIMNAGSAKRKQLLGPGLPPGDPRSRIETWECRLSPDAKKIAFINENARQTPLGTQSPLWSMNADGSGLKNHSIDPSVFKEEKDCVVRLAAWTASGDSVLLAQQGRRSGIPSRLWLVNLNDGASRALLEYSGISWYFFLSPSGRQLAVPYKIVEKDSSRLAIALVDLDSLAVKSIDVAGDRSIFRMAWSPGSDRLAVLVRKGTLRGTGAFILEVLSIPDGKILASREMTTEERIGQLYGLDWMKDGIRLALGDPGGGRCLKILGSKLEEEKTFPVPASVGSPWSIMVSNDKILVAKNDPERLWRVDLGTKRWKRLY